MYCKAIEQPGTPITDLPPELLNYLLEKYPDEPLTAELVIKACGEIAAEKEDQDHE
ncbi:MAG: hypothetical protein LIO54_08295 [Oscillospiraceae bacterium]|nr:hypothetical protein [Oscillospiraceae bacterium]